MHDERKRLRLHERSVRMMEKERHEVATNFGRRFGYAQTSATTRVSFQTIRNKLPTLSLSTRCHAFFAFLVLSGPRGTHIETFSFTLFHVASWGKGARLLEH